MVFPKFQQQEGEDGGVLFILSQRSSDFAAASNRLETSTASDRFIQGFPLNPVIESEDARAASDDHEICMDTC